MAGSENMNMDVDMGREIDAALISENDERSTVKKIKVLLNKNEFVELSTSPAYVDKTLLIQVVLYGCSQQTLIIAPRRFNKTSNLRMLQAFFSLEASTLEERREAFKRCKISKQEDAMSHFGSYPVIYADFASGRRDLDSEEDAVNRCRDIMVNTFAKHADLYDFFNTPEIKAIEHRLNGITISELNRWFKPCEFGEPDREMITNSLTLLAKCLKYYYKKKPILLIDEFDSMCNDALFRCNETVLNQIISFYSTMTGNLLKVNQDDYEKAVLTGITSVAYKGLTTSLTNLAKFRFLRADKFSLFYGLTGPEFNELMNRKGLEERKTKKEEALNFYNGYQYQMEDGTRFAVLNLLSVVKFLAYGKVEPYWEGSGLVAGLSETIRCDKVIRMVYTLLQGNTVQIEYLKDTHSFKPSNLALFNEIAKNPTKFFVDTDFLFNFLLQHGYVAIDSEVGNYVNIKIPNEDAYSALFKIIRNFYVTVCGYDEEILKQCGECLVALNQSDVDVEKKMNELCLCLDHVVRENEKHTNEYWFEHLLFYIVFNKRQIFEVNTRKRKRFDVLISAKTETKTDFLFELKVCTPKKAPENALDQIITKEYHEACKSSRYFLIGITLVNEPGNKTVEIEYLHNTKDLTQRILCHVK